LDQATFAKVTSVPAASLDTVGAGASDNPPKTIDAPALTKDGKPRVLYVGAEYCPYCATERWPLVVALSRFGTWNNLSASFSAPAPEVNPNTATVSFHGATYSSQYVSFTGYETSTNKQTNGQWGKLDTLEGEDLALFQKFNAPPYVQSSGAIPWINLGGTSIQAGASYNSAVILNKTQAEIATALADPTTDIAKGVNGAANVLTAQICKSTNQQPTAVCTAPGVVAAAAKLQ
jgi:archaellum component FlaG (FlaF/FlaG flagellin family)